VEGAGIPSRFNHANFLLFSHNLWCVIVVHIVKKILA